MPRPKNKEELLCLSQENFKKLNDFIDQYSKDEQLAEFAPGTLNRNIRDVLAHLYHWHIMMLDWYRVGKTGKMPDMPAKGYSWKNTPELNQWIRDHYKETDLEEVRNLIQKSHDKIMGLIESHTNEELFQKKRYKWTGSTSLGAYLVSTSSSHYEWALKLIKKGMK